MRRRTTLIRMAGTLLAGAAAWPGGTAAQATVVEVGIQDYKFQPATLQVKVGTTVKWNNLEKRTSHSVIFSGPAGFEGERIFPGESWQFRFDKPGIFVYSCGPHPEMKGQIEVLP